MPRFPRLIGLTMSQMAEVQRRVTHDPLYPQLRAEAEAAHAAMHAAEEAFAAAQEAVDDLWAREATRFVEELDP